VEDHFFGNINVAVILGRFDDSDLDLVVKSQDIPLGIPSGRLATQEKEVGSFNVTIKEASNADNIIYWPSISIGSANRREIIYNATIEALKTAEQMQATRIGFFTMGLEVARVPSWEIAEEIVKAINNYSREQSPLKQIKLVASSPTQVSSFQFAVNNITIISGK